MTIQQVFIILMAKDTNACMALLVTNLIFSKKYTHENKNFFNQNLVEQMQDGRN